MSTAENVGAGPGYTARELTVHRRPAELAKVTRALRATGRPITLVPTMGALHEGHLELIRAARKVPAAVTVVSIFVNPLQFGPGEDLDRYPRSFEADLELCREEGVELVLAPEPADMYAPDRQVGLTAGGLGEQLEGASRPGHFDGMLTVVAKLIGIVRPDLALFGEKDYQQLVLIRRMARDLNFDSRIQGVPIVRQADGLALSSRNAYLSDEQRQAALGLSAAMAAGVHAGPAGPDAVLAAARAVLDSEPLVRVDYLELRDVELGPVPDAGEARLLVAAEVGDTRLIDNALVQLGPAPE
ncbi:pantoate--beta-alanine ligase [Saccharopolyspora gloriosae]|uniref:Pantothenate synthetase n=1 Tax=Saccharopolyspora gloriosae TaxID=455344 RepID=A0A840NVX5_9PSEU|nr:pantoate--beta-alanine ligase [Saccharopolyspora gloriosae]MBB5072277.1 pantoate--beta-alanine ligase [Saccharopolyspora gloriosae]